MTFAVSSCTDSDLQDERCELADLTRDMLRTGDSETGLVVVCARRGRNLIAQWVARLTCAFADTSSISGWGIFLKFEFF